VERRESPIRRRLAAGQGFTTNAGLFSGNNQEGQVHNIDGPEGNAQIALVASFVQTARVPSLTSNGKPIETSSADGCMAPS
jgi:hypothetical protein